MITWFSSKNTKEDSRQEKDDFISLASHELRTPLSVIKWYTEMLLDEDAGSLTEDQRKYITTIESSNQRAIDLVRSLLNVSRLSSGTFCISPEKVFISDLVEEIIASFEKDIKKKDLILVKHYLENASVVSDRTMCLVAIRSLIKNAIAFSLRGQSIVCSTSLVTKGDSVNGMTAVQDSLLLSVADTGNGIPEADKQKIFSKMFKGSNSKDSEISGSGLGLYIAKTTMDSLGGNIWFNSKEGEGSTFFITFPIHGVTKKEGTTTLE